MRGIHVFRNSRKDTEENRKNYLKKALGSPRFAQPDFFSRSFFVSPLALSLNG